MRYSIITSILVAVTCFSVSAGVIGVPGEYTTIQSAIDGAVDGDTVRVARGLYIGRGNRDIDFRGKALVVISEEGPEVTVIDCGGSPDTPHRGFHFRSHESGDSRLEGFTIRKGFVRGPWPEGFGGGILCDEASPTICNCIITDNTASFYGGGIYCNESEATFDRCTITRNRAEWSGGIDCSYSSPFICNCIIAENEAVRDGGGINCLWSSPVLYGCTILGNGACCGGGISCELNSCPSIVSCEIQDNMARSNGGGVYCWGSSPSVTGCILWFNSPQEIFVHSGDPQVACCTIQDRRH